MNIFIVGIREGRFIVQLDKKTVGTCDLNAEALAGLLREGGFTFKEPPEDILLHSSSVNHPEDYGAPEGFRAHDVIEATLLALTV